MKLKNIYFEISKKVKEKKVNRNIDKSRGERKSDRDKERYIKEDTKTNQREIERE